MISSILPKLIDCPTLNKWPSYPYGKDPNKFRWLVAKMSQFNGPTMADPGLY